MRVLLLYPQDDLTEDLQHRGPWDAVFDLGDAAADFYQRGRDLLHCPVGPLRRLEFADVCRLRSPFLCGYNRITDNFGFDWWKLIQLEFLEELLDVLRVMRFVNERSAHDQFYCSRDGTQTRLLRALCPERVHILPQGCWGHIRNKATRVTRLSPWQIFQVLGDKYDSSYRLRRLFLRRNSPSTKPVVLLPSAYENASRTALAYARNLPELNFLLLTTRPGGQVIATPANLQSARLASYAPERCDESEVQHLLSGWKDLLTVLNEAPELRLLIRAGHFDRIPRILRRGLAIRDAWLNVFASEPILSVLCADEMNWQIRLPLLIAHLQGLPAIACHHGALDWRYSFQETSADYFLAKGQMEWNYLVELCGMDREKIAIAAPLRSSRVDPGSSRKDSIVFFSEPYEASGGRCRGYYEGLLPRLAELAEQSGRRLVLKLHPFESRRERKRLAEDILPVDRRHLLHIADGPLNEPLLQRAWFGITITSSTAVDCALSEVPMFLCQWLDFSCNEYAEQFIRFGAARGLRSELQIAEIPHILRNSVWSKPQGLWQGMENRELRSLISEGAQAGLQRTQTHEAEQVWA